jgi:predicted nucleic acid-binding protein
MRTAVDTNVLSALWSGEPLASSVSGQLNEASSAGGLVICAAVYAELIAHPKAKFDFVDHFLSATGISIDFDLGEPVWREASVRFAKYATRRRASRGGRAKRLLADFIVGAHALLRSDRLLTLDTSRYLRDFPELKQITLA